MSNPKVDDAFNSMLRTDYIALRDTAKLNLLADYYVDFYGFLRQVLSESDQLIVGRRGTGKTTLLYRVLVECMRSWDPQQQSIAKPRTLAIYIDLNKCQALSDIQSDEFADFEHVFVSEFCDAIAEEISRSWPAVNAQPGFFAALFNSAAQKKATETKALLRKLATVLQSGLPRVIDRSGKVDANKHDLGDLESRYTEEEIKIIGSIRSSSLEDQLIARQVADDVGCHVQKVSKFGEKLEREGIITRARIEELRKNIYYGSDGGQE